MLTHDPRAGFVVEGVLLCRHVFTSGRRRAARGLSRAAYARAAREQREVPVAVLEADGRTWWWHRDRFWCESEGLRAEDVLVLVEQRERRKRRRLESARAGVAAERRREPIPREVRLAVWRRDGGRCVRCESDFELQFDHVIPHALGGAASIENLQLLCASCNRAKGAALD
jgi:hypothetical protein